MLNNPRATELSDHQAAFKGPTFRVTEESSSHKVTRTDLEESPVVARVQGTDEDALREARTQAQVLAKRESSSDQAAIVRIIPRDETLGFGGRYEERKRTPTPPEDLEELEDVPLREPDPVGECIEKEMESGVDQDQAVAICLSKRDRGELSDTALELSDEDASEPNPDIEVNQDVEKQLRELVEEHNSEVEKESREATIGQLKSVYSRGRGAFTQTSRPGVDSATQWALARVKNAYLPLLKTGTPPNEDYVQDNDLLPPGHPKSTREASDRQATLGNDEDEEEDQELIDRTDLDGQEDDSEKADFTKKAETLRPYEDEQETLEVSDVEIDRMMELTEARQIFQEYQERTELTPDQLEEWLSGDCHERASGDDSEKHIKRAMFLLDEIDTAEDSVTVKVPEDLAMERAERRIPEELEGEVDGQLAVFQMEYALSFIKRHEAMVDDIQEVETDTEECPTVTETALRNWGGSHYSNPQI